METESANGEEESSNLTSRSGRKHPFFRRSDSTLCLGCPQPDPFTVNMVEALPLADQPHLLQPTARREELFGAPRQPITVQPSTSNPPGTTNPLEVMPTRLGLSTRTSEIHTGHLHAVLPPPPPPPAVTTPGEIAQEGPQNLSLKDSDAVEVVELVRVAGSSSSASVASSVIVSPRRASSASVQSVIVRTGSVRDASAAVSPAASSATSDTLKAGTPSAHAALNASGSKDKPENSASAAIHSKMVPTGMYYRNANLIS